MIRKRGFTLIELLVAVAIFATIAVVLYSCFRGGVMAWRRIESESASQQRLRGVFATITKDIKNMIYMSNIPFEGNESQAAFVTCMNLSEDGSSNVKRISYFLAPSEDEDAPSSSLLIRKEEELIDVISMLEPEEEEEEIIEEVLEPAQEGGETLLEGVSEINLSYMLAAEQEEAEEEGIEYEWVQMWEQADALPRGMKIEITFADSGDGQATSISRRIWIPTAKPSESAEETLEVPEEE
ncbi:MAG: prepilin-type N-terminal cleavage/methylation domain-containing protein [Candidatus Omnitrophica bacterium]|nr:prepilin-type N-terminal cleavage/methylation domain-containing protein [Candidatus Omnitrophota bacterium]